MAQKIPYFFIAILLGCSSHYKKPESIESKMTRFQSKDLALNRLPQIEVVNFRPTARGLASMPKENSGKSLKYSNKKLYFLTLYRQHKEFAGYAQGYENLPEISICPSFHTTLVNYRNKKNISMKHLRRDYRPLFNTKNLDASIYPELSLSTPEGISVKEKIKRNPNEDVSQIVLKGVVFHRKKIHQELQELCEYGYSKNYYAYENLITKQEKERVLTANTEGIKILLKTMPFVNKFLLDSLNSSSRKKINRNIASIQKKEDDPYYQALVQQFKTPWIKDYFQNIRQRRLER